MNKDRVKFIAIVALQIAFLIFLIFSKQYTLATGTKIMLKTAPVDPRSLFSGDYVTLGYEIGEIDLSKVKTDIDYLNKSVGNFVSEDSKKYVYVKLSKKGNDIYWTPDSATLSKPILKDNEVFVKSKDWHLSSFSNRAEQTFDKDSERKYIRITYDFSSFYVPEDMGREIESKMRNTSENEASVEVSVGKNGNALLSRLFINGIPVSF